LFSSFGCILVLGLTTENKARAVADKRPDNFQDAIFKLNLTLNPLPDITADHTADSKPDRHNRNYRRVCEIEKAGSQLPRSLSLS